MRTHKAAKDGGKFRIVKTEEKVLDSAGLQQHIAEKKQHLGMVQKQKQHILGIEDVLLKELADCESLLAEDVGIGDNPSRE